jgi:hypothetical protein
MEGSSLTTSLRYQTLLFFSFCNQLPSARLVIRRAVEMESLQFVGCSWFIGLIDLGFGFTQNKSISNEMCASVPFPRLL